MSDFFTAVSYGKNCTSRMEKFIEGVDNYFYLGVRKKQCVITGQEHEKDKATILLDQKASLVFLKIISFFTAVVPLVMIALKVVLRCTHQFHIINPKQKLEEGMHISSETIQKMQTVADKILKVPREGIDDAVTELDASVINDDLMAAFFFKENTGRRTDTIQMYNEEAQAEEQFRHMIKANEACIYHNLDHLALPHAKMIEAGHRKFIAREGMQVLEGEMMRSSNPAIANQLKESVKQLTRFVIEACMTGKICIEDGQDAARKKVILLDPKPFPGSVLQALFGGHDDIDAAGIPLIDAFSSEELIDAVLDEAHKYGVMDPAREARIRVSRIEQIQVNPREEPAAYNTLTI